MPNRTFGRYELEEELGRGAMGIVYRARERSTGREVALKVLKATGAVDETARRRFEREARLPARVRHPAIVEVLDAGTEDGVPFIALALVRGRPLSAITLGLRQHVALLAKVARAVGTAHRAGVIHRDLKPSNVIVEDGTGEPCLVDFGIAFDARLDASRLSRTGEIVGTPAYMAPEVFAEGAAPHDPRADVYALGMMLYERLNGVHPMKGLSSREVMDRVVSGIPSLPLDVDPFLGGLAHRSVARSPGKRPADGIVFAEELERWLRGAAPKESGGRPIRFVLLGAGAGLAILAGVLGGLWLLGRTPPPPTPVKVTPPAPPPPPPVVAAPPPPLPPTKMARPFKKMPAALVDEMERRVDRAFRGGQIDAIRGELSQFGLDYPDDSRSVHFRAMGLYVEAGRELEARRELLRATTCRPTLGESAFFRTLLAMRSLGFDLAATALAMRATQGMTTVSPELVKAQGMGLLVVEPPYRDPARSKELLTRASESGLDPMLPYYILHARFGMGERETLAPDFAQAAEDVKKYIDADSVERLRDRGRRCLTGAPADRMAHVYVIGLSGTHFLDAIEQAELSWRRSWAAEDAVAPARFLLRVAAEEARTRRDEHAAIAYFQAARAFEAAGDKREKLDALAKGFERAERARVDVRALLARAYARELLATGTDLEKAEKVARASVVDSPAGELEPRVAEEVADGWLVVAEILLARGKKADARAAIAKGLASGTFDKRPFEAVRAKTD